MENVHSKKIQEGCGNDVLIIPCVDIYIRVCISEKICYVSCCGNYIFDMNDYIFQEYKKAKVSVSSKRHWSYLHHNYSWAGFLCFQRLKMCFLYLVLNAITCYKNNLESGSFLDILIFLLSDFG